MLGALNPLGVSWSLKSILAALILPGCMIAALSNQVAMGHEFTPEQIDAYRKVGLSVYGCVKVGGPPPSGNAIFILVPEGETYSPVWGDDCHIQR